MTRPAEPTADDAPWMAAPALPPPADPRLHAYFDQGRAHAGSIDGVRGAICGDSSRTICWVWDPSSAGWSCAEEVPWLLDAVRAREGNVLASLRHSAAQTSILLLLPLGLALWFGGSIAAFAWMLTMLGLAPLAEYSWGLYQLRAETAEAVARRARQVRYVAWLGRRSARWTWALVAGIAIVGVVQVVAALKGGMAAAILAAAIVKPAVRNGEWWRLLTGTLLHGSLPHLLFNGLSLWSLGRVVELTFGWAYLPLVFVVAAVAGSLCSLALVPDTTSVGASGGILGMLGFILAATWRRTPGLPELVSRGLVRGVLYCALGGVVAFSVIDNAGHLGGFVAGAALGIVLARLDQVRVGGDVSAIVKLAGLTASGVVLAGIAGAILVMLEAAFSRAG